MPSYFTSLAGKTKYWQWGWRWDFQTSKGGPVAPKYFWKAVCDPDPAVQQSIFFIAENNVNNASKDKVESASCFKMKMTKEKGVVECESISEAAGKCMRSWWHSFVVPDFDPVKCGTARKGNFLQPHLNFK